MDSSIALVALRCGLRATEESFKARRECFLEKLQCFQLGKDLLKKLILGKDAAMKAMSTCFANMEKKSSFNENRERDFDKF